MLNRRQLRIKALQSLYSHFVSGSSDLVTTEKQLLKNVDELYELYTYLFSLIIEISEFAEERIESGKKKHMPTEADLNPNTRFVENKLIKILKDNADLQKKIEKYKINWKTEKESIIRKIYRDFIAGEAYQEFMNKESASFSDDKDIIISLINDHFIYHDLLPSYFEEKHSSWSEDYYIVLSLVINTIKFIKKNRSPEKKMPPLFKPDGGDRLEVNQDKKFLIDLVRKTILKREEYDKIIKSKAKNWEFDRIATIDLILIRMGMAEIYEFPTIPLKVTLNEIIELAKHFSSPKSKVFINGLLDRVIAEGLEDKTIVKQGRGLLD